MKRAKGKLGMSVLVFFGFLGILFVFGQMEKGKETMKVEYSLLFNNGFHSGSSVPIVGGNETIFEKSRFYYKTTMSDFMLNDKGQFQVMFLHHDYSGFGKMTRGDLTCQKDMKNQEEQRDIPKGMLKKSVFIYKVCPLSGGGMAVVYTTSKDLDNSGLKMDIQRQNKGKSTISTVDLGDILKDRTENVNRAQIQSLTWVNKDQLGLLVKEYTDKKNHEDNRKFHLFIYDMSENKFIKCRTLDYVPIKIKGNQIIGISNDKKNWTIRDLYSDEEKMNILNDISESEYAVDFSRGRLFLFTKRGIVSYGANGEKINIWKPADAGWKKKVHIREILVNKECEIIISTFEGEKQKEHLKIQRIKLK